MAWKHRTVKQEEAVIGLTNGHSQREIAALTGLTQTQVLHVQRKYHLVLSFGQSVSSAQFRYRWDPYVWGRVIELLYVTERLPLTEVADRCGVNVHTIRRRMDVLGIPRRTPGESNRGRRRAPYQRREKVPA